MDKHYTTTASTSECDFSDQITEHFGFWHVFCAVHCWITSLTDHLKTNVTTRCKWSLKTNKKDKHTFSITFKPSTTSKVGCCLFFYSLWPSFSPQRPPCLSASRHFWQRAVPLGDWLCRANLLKWCWNAELAWSRRRSCPPDKETDANSWKKFVNDPPFYVSAFLQPSERACIRKQCRGEGTIGMIRRQWEQPWPCSIITAS